MPNAIERETANTNKTAEALEVQATSLEKLAEAKEKRDKAIAGKEAAKARLRTS